MGRSSENKRCHTSGYVEEGVRRKRVWYVGGWGQVKDSIFIGICGGDDEGVERSALYLGVVVR
jgi:hypothetical protein